MTKLTDSQLIVLSAASQRDDGAAAVPTRMNEPAAAKVGASLVARKLMREMRAKPGMPVWRKDDDDRPISLIITRAGRGAIGVEEAGDDAKGGQPAQASQNSAAVGARTEGADRPSTDARQKKTPGKAGVASAVKTSSSSDTHVGGDQGSEKSADLRAGSKQALLVEMMSKGEGATLAALSGATDWLPHTTRAALTGLRKRGFVIERIKREKLGALYRVGLAAA